MPIRNWPLFQAALCRKGAFPGGESNAPKRNAVVQSLERLEFLGDAVVEASVQKLLADRHPDSSPEELRRASGSLVAGVYMYRIAMLLELDKFVVDSLPVRSLLPREPARPAFWRCEVSSVRLFLVRPSPPLLLSLAGLLPWSTCDSSQPGLTGSACLSPITDQ